MDTTDIDRAAAERRCRKCGSEKITRKYFAAGDMANPAFRANQIYFRMGETSYSYDGEGVQMPRF